MSRARQVSAEPSTDGLAPTAWWRASLAARRDGLRELLEALRRWLADAAAGCHAFMTLAAKEPPGS